MENITLKNSAGVDTIFTVRRQPGTNVPALLQAQSTGGTRVAQAKIEIGTTVRAGRSEPVATVVVPYGSTVNGVFSKAGQVTNVIRASQPDAAPDVARLDAEAYASQLAAHIVLRDLFRDGNVS